MKRQDFLFFFVTLLIVLGLGFLSNYIEYFVRGWITLKDYRAVNIWIIAMGVISALAFFITFFSFDKKKDNTKNEI